MNDRRCIVFCILTDQRILDDGFAQIAIYIATSYTFIDRIFQTSTFKMHILSDLHKYNSHAGILTDRDHILSGNSQIFLQLLQNLFAKHGLFCILCIDKRFFHIICQKMIRFNAHFFYLLCNVCNLYRSHASTNLFLLYTCYFL